jgi:UDP-GlcNAc:undecaprenyl-phosphate/decaprenyl-phosphate GlcNAc-1-phosphate transferase
MIGSELSDHLEIVYGLVIAAVIVIALTPAVGGMARMLGAVDRGRRAVPRLGGLALFFGIFVPALAFLDLTHEMRGLLLGAAVATTVGAIDDFRGLRWWEKLGGQFVAASIAAGFGIWIHRFTFPVLGVHELPAWVGVPLTVFGIVAVMNMVNFLDGLDGLAAGVCGISAATFALIELDLGNWNLALLGAVVFGATMGFLRHNFYPARIFMGDSGALLLGFTLATISVSGLLKTASIVSLFLPLAVLAVPILDTSFVVAKRIKHGVPPYERDESHLHHRFLNIGFTQRRAVLTIYLWCLTLSAAALATRFVKPHPHGEWRPWALAVDAAIGLVAVAMSVYIVYLLEIVKLANPYIRRREHEERERKTA